MKRNLKKLLSVLLVLAIAAVNFTIPAMAATTITVNYKTGLPTGIYGTNTSYLQQGIWFYETSAGNQNVGSGTDTTSNIEVNYAPLEMSSIAARAALNMKASEWIRYQVTAETAGYYSVVLNYNVTLPAGADVLVRTDDHIVSDHLDKTRTATTFEDSASLGYVYLTEGVNNLYVDNKSASAQFNLRTIILTLDETNTVDATDVDILRPVASATEIGDYTIDYADGYNQITVAGDLSFPLNIEADGKYQVSVMGKTTGEHTAVATIDDAAAEATVSNTAYEETALGVFRLTEGEYSLSLSGLEDYNLAWVKVKYVGTYSTELVTESIETDTTVARGIDSYVADFNDYISDVAEGQITLSADGTEIPVKVIVDEKTLTVAFLETLEDATTYTLTLNGIQGVFDEEAMEERVITFTTDDTMELTEFPTVEVTSVASISDAGTIKGVVKGSTGEGIKGRTVTIKNSLGETVVEGISGDNGVFELDFTIEEVDAGDYAYVVESEYGASATATVVYVSPEEELRILSGFTSATTWEQVKAIITGNLVVLRVPNHAADMTAIREVAGRYTYNESLFYKHFIGQTFVNIEEGFLPFYNKMLLLEKMNHAANSGNYVKANYLTNPDNLTAIGIDPADLAMASTDSDKTSFADAYVDYVRRNGPAETEADFLARIPQILLSWIKTRYQIPAEVALVLQTTPTNEDEEPVGPKDTVKAGGVISVPVSFTAEQNSILEGNTTAAKLNKLVFTITADDTNIFDNVNMEEYNNIGEATITKSETDVVIEVVYASEERIPVTEIGKITFSTSDVATYNVTINSSVTYTAVSSNGTYTDVEIPLNELELTATVNAAPGERPSRPSGAVGADDDDDESTPPPAQKPVDEETAKPVYYFDDMAEATWAKDMVHTLVGKGVISKNNERAFRPMDNVTREEYVKMIVTVIGSHDEGAVSTLSDVASNHWATSYIATAQKLGLVTGNETGEFGLGENITRQDMAVIIFRTFEMLGIDLKAGDAQFTDGSDIASYATAAVSALEEIGIINGMGDNTFAPRANATRAQAAKVIYVMMEVLGL